MKDAVDIPRVSTVEPLFSKSAAQPVCTRTWEASEDPRLTHGDIVDVGGTVCRVAGKTEARKPGSAFVTYRFIPYKPFA